jgi:hypothetical protein
MSSLKNAKLAWVLSKRATPHFVYVHSERLYRRRGKSVET